MKTTTATAQLAQAFRQGAVLTGNEISEQFGLANPRQAVASLRAQGLCIYTNKNGYKLGAPSKSMIALAHAVAGAGIFAPRAR